MPGWERRSFGNRTRYKIWLCWTYIQQLCEDTGCCPEDLPRAMNDREEWRERVRDIRAASAIWWWWNKLDFVRKNHHHHHHHVELLAQISLTLSRHFSLSFIASGRSSGLHPVSSHSCWMYVRAGRPAFIRPYVGIHRSTSIKSSSLLLQQCPACLVRLTWIVFVMECW